MSHILLSLCFFLFLTHLKLFFDIMQAIATCWFIWCNYLIKWKNCPLIFSFLYLFFVIKNENVNNNSMIISFQFSSIVYPDYKDEMKTSFLYRIINEDKFSFSDRHWKIHASLVHRKLAIFKNYLALKFQKKKFNFFLWILFKNNTIFVKRIKVLITKSLI